MRVAALFVMVDGAYAGLPDVDLWDVERDARGYGGPHPVVAHPPCQRWCMPLAKVNETRYGHRVGDDGGCFAAALAAVRRWGGVLEHPAATAAWAAFDLADPCGRAWQRTLDGGWVCEVAQSIYGHPAEKRTWLYYVGVRAPLPMRWGDGEITAITSWLQRTSSPLPRLSKRDALHTPAAFRDALLELARAAAC